MKAKLCLRTYAECIRPYMKKKSIFKSNVGRARVKEEPIDGQGVHAFYSMLLDALINNVAVEEQDGIPDVSNSFTTHIKSGETDIHNKFVELAQRDTSVNDVEDYFSKYLIPNIPNESLDTINDAVMELINNDDSIGVTKQEKLRESFCNSTPEHFHAEVLVFVVQRNQNKIEFIADTKSDRYEDETVIFALEQLERKMSQNKFQALEVICDDGNNHTFNFPKTRKDKKTYTSIGAFCCGHSPLLIYGKGGSGKTSLVQYAIMEIHNSMKCKYICFSDIYKAVENGNISNAEDFIHMCTDIDAIFLDGINEMTTNGFDHSDRITGKLCSIIGDICCSYNDIKLIITGCFSNKGEAISAANMISMEVCLVEIKGIWDDDYIHMVCNEKGSSFSELLKRPLYYNAYKSLDMENIHELKDYSRYSLLSLFYDQMYRRCNMKVSGPVDIKKIIYNEIPKLAYNMLFESYRKPNPADNMSDGFESVATNLDAIFVKHIDAEGRVWFSFEHQDYRDFLAAMYFKNCVDDIYSSVPVQFQTPDFSNFSDTTITMLIESFNDFIIMDDDFNGVSIDNGILKKTEWWKKYKIVEPDFNNIQERMSIGFEIGYYLADPLRHSETNKNIYYDGYAKLIENYFSVIELLIISPFPLEPSEKWGGIVEKIARKHVELLRRARLFEKAFTCLNILINYFGEEPKSALLNQKAKLLMYRAQYSDENSQSDFVEGYKLLKKSAKSGNVMSNNLLGRIYASPSPIVTEYLGKDIRDIKKGFLYFYNNVRATWKKKKLTLYEKYSYVRCAKMLLHGNIDILSEKAVLGEDCIKICDKLNKPDTLSIKYADIFLKHANSNSPYAMYLQGIVSYYQSALTAAISEFKIVIARETCSGKILPSLYLYQIFYNDHTNTTDAVLEDILNNNIINGINTLSNWENDLQEVQNFERYHPQYLLEDIRYVLGCLNETNNAIKLKGVEI